MADNLSTRPVFGEDSWLTVPQLAAELKIHPATVRIWIKAGRFRAVRVGREWRVRRSEVDRALLSDTSPAYADQDLASSPAPTSVQSITPAPRQIADHIMTVTPVAGPDS